MRANSRVVSDASISGTPGFEDMPGSATATFFAVHGMSATEKIFYGARPFFSANQVFTTAPNICIGLFADERC